jgi:hypothetical protein
MGANRTSVLVFATLLTFTVGCSDSPTDQTNATPGLAVQLACPVEPADAIAWVEFPTPLQVAIQDGLGDVVATATDPITLALGSNPGGGSLMGTLTVSAVNGVATFDGLSIDKPGDGFTLVASSGDLTDATCSPFDVICPNSTAWNTHLAVGPTISSPNAHFVADKPPAAAMADDGGYVIAWNSTSQNTFGAYFQRYSRDGSPVGSTATASDPSHFLNTAPAVAMAGSGEFVVAYTPTNQGTFGAYFQRYDSNGDPVGSVVRASDPAHFVVASPAVAISDGGGFVVAWNARNQGTFGAYFQRFDSGGNLVGPVVRASDPNHFVNLSPAVAMSDAGGFVVAWTATNQGTFGAYFQRFDSGGNAVGSVVRASDPGHFTTVPPAAAMAPDGRFVIAWLDESNNNVHAQAYTAEGAVSGSIAQLNQTGAIRDNTDPLDEAPAPVSVAMNADGNFVAAWTKGGNPFSTFARRFDAVGSALSGETEISGGEFTRSPPAVAAAGCFDNYVVAWSDDDTDFDVEHVVFLADDNADGIADQCCAS